MNVLNRATQRRLQKLPQQPTVWEGDRRPLMDSAFGPGLADPKTPGECILWVDGSQAMVRAMDMVSTDMGTEAMVRTLLRAMEHPHGPTKPARPQKIVVRDRELQFFLRGVLQDLNITVDYASELPLINEIFISLQSAMEARPPSLPPEYAVALNNKAMEIWEDAPWEFLEEQQILALELNQWDLGTLYVSVLGMMGMEYGLLLYRSLDSLIQFRQQAMSNDPLVSMEEAFLQQDCLFLTFDLPEEEPTMGRFLEVVPDEPREPSFGNLHPLEGLRSFLHEEEAIALWASLEALHRFFKQHRRKLTQDFPKLSSRYRITLPPNDDAENPTVSITVSTQPDIAAELLEMLGEDDEDDFDSGRVLQEGLVPRERFLSLGAMPWERVELLRLSARHHQPASGKMQQKGDGLPILLIQTSLPKAKTFIQELEAKGGVLGIGFNPAEDPYNEELYELGVLVLGNDEYHPCGEFQSQDPIHISARQKWDKRCQQTGGYCGLVIARGLKGDHRGQPQLNDIWALFEVKALSSDDLDLGVLQLRFPGED